MAKLEWHGKELERKLRHATAEGIVRAATFYHERCRDAVSRPNSGVRGRGAGGRFKKTVYPNPSKPGEPPRLRTGFGQRNIVVNHWPEEMKSRVGVTRNGMYMIFLELGTRHIARRPWLVSTLQQHAKVIGALAVSGSAS